MRQSTLLPFWTDSAAHLINGPHQLGISGHSVYQLSDQLITARSTQGINLTTS